MTFAVTVTERQLNRATLARNLLLEREQSDIVEAVRRLGPLQAQEPSTPYLALWNRIAGFDPVELDAAFTARRLVRSSLIRLTLHVVPVEDWPGIHTVMAPSLRASRVNDARFDDSGLSAEETDALLPELATFLARPRTGAEIEEHLDASVGPEASGRRAWWALRRYAPVHHAPTGGPWSFGAVTSYVTAGAGPDADRYERDVADLLRRYLGAFGPATLPDFAQFTMLRRPAAQLAAASLGPEVVPVRGPGGRKLLDLAEATLPDDDRNANVEAPPRLLPMWDSVLLAYADRTRVIPAGYRAAVLRRNGDVLPTLLVDGSVAGVWRPVDGGIEATAFHPLDEATWKGLKAEAEALWALLSERDPEVYRRYAHWWDKAMPAAEVRRLAGD
jgi:Winged helix DNA-binding domain